MVVHVVTTGL